MVFLLVLFFATKKRTVWGDPPPGGARPRGVAEFTKSVAEFTKSSLQAKKNLQVSKILLIFVAILLQTNDINTI